MSYPFGFQGFGLPSVPRQFPHDAPGPGEAGYRWGEPSPCRRCGLTAGDTCPAAVALATYEDVQAIKRDVEKVKQDIARIRQVNLW